MSRTLPSAHPCQLWQGREVAGGARSAASRSLVDGARPRSAQMAVPLPLPLSLSHLYLPPRSPSFVDVVPSHRPGPECCGEIAPPRALQWWDGVGRRERPGC